MNLLSRGLGVIWHEQGFERTDRRAITINGTTGVDDVFVGVLVQGVNPPHNI